MLFLVATVGRSSWKTRLGAFFPVRRPGSTRGFRVSIGAWHLQVLSWRSLLFRLLITLPLAAGNQVARRFVAKVSLATLARRPQSVGGLLAHAPRWSHSQLDVLKAINRQGG